MIQIETLGLVIKKTMYLCGRSGFVLSSLVCFALDLFCEKARPSRVKSSSRREEFYYHSSHFLLAMQYKVQERQSVYFISSSFLRWSNRSTEIYSYF